MSNRINVDIEGVWLSPGFPMHQAVVEPEGRRVHLTGQVAWDADQNVHHRGDAEAQTHMAFDNIERVITAIGGTLADIVSMNTYLTRREDWPAITRAREARLDQENGPVSTGLLVSGLADPDLLVELQCIAVIAEDQFRDLAEGDA